MTIQPLTYFLDYLRNEKKYSEHTLTAYERDVEQLYVFVAEHYGLEGNVSSVSAITMDYIRTWMAHLATSGIKPRSISRKLSSVKSYYKFLKNKELIEVNPAHVLQSPRTPKYRLPHCIEEEKIMLLLDSVPFTPDFEGIRDKTILELFFATGIRLNELITLKTSSIDFARKTLRVLGKGNKERIMPLGEKQLHQVKQYLQVRQATFTNIAENSLFLTNKGNCLYARFVYRLTTRYLGYVSTKEMKNPHILRHTFATCLLNNGAELNAVKKLLGHASLASTQVYTHISIEKMKKTYSLAHPRNDKD